jgi:cytochrome c556
MHRKHGWLGLAALGAVLAGIGAAGAADVYKDREALMKGFGQRMNVIKGAVVEGKGTLVDAATAAQEITANAEKIPSVFPNGTNAGESEALPVIWEQWPGFEGKAQNMHDLAAKLAAAAASGDKAITLAAFADLGKNGCGGCHETYRKKKS